MRIFTFGDSHARDGWEKVILSSVEVIIRTIGPKLMYTFGQQGLDLLNIKNYGVQDDDTVVFCFGEIDVRSHVGKFVDQKYTDIIDTLVDKYFNAIKSNVQQFKSLKVWVYFIPPTVMVDNSIYKNKEFPFCGSDENRKQYVLYMNKKLSEKCIEFGYIFVDLYDQYCDKYGFLDVAKRKDVHINNPEPLISFIKQMLGMKKWRDIDGMFADNEGVALQKRAVGKICVELGSYKGRSTVCLAEVAKHVYSIDMILRPEFKENIIGYPITYHTMSVRDASKLFEPDCVDLILEDTSHTYETVRDNILLWWDKLKLDGVMCFHDYGHILYPDVLRVVYDFFGSVNKKNLVGGLMFINKAEVSFR